MLEWNARHTRAHLPHTMDDYGGPLHLVTDHNIAKLLLDHGADVNDLSDLGETPFHVAARNGRLDVAKLLLDHGAHINAHGYEIIDTFDVRATPLRYALEALGNHFLMAKLLLDRGADHNLADSEEGTALHVAARLGCEKSTKLLLDHGAPLDVQDDTGWTALHIASYLGHSAVAKVLVNCGAYLNILDRQGNSPTDLAVRNGYFQTMMLVLARYEAN